MIRIRNAGLAALVLLLVPAPGCDDAPPPAALITTELNASWANLPHRISAWEMTTSAQAGFEAASATLQNDGGDFGRIDRAQFRVGFSRWRASNLIVRDGSVWVEIPPSDPTQPETHQLQTTTSLVAPEFASAETLGAFVRGYRIDTDRYETRPAFETDIPYDPGVGYTSQGFGIQLGEPTFDGENVSLDVTARNSLGPSDRPDMNAAMALASTWVRVDFVVVGARGESAAHRASVSYDLSFPEWDIEQEHEHADPEVQGVSLAGDVGFRNGLFGLTGFDFWLNVPGRGASDCVEMHDELNYNGEPVSGPGRYVREMSVRLWDTRYDAATGLGEARVDMMLSNRSMFEEVGNVCLEVRGEVGLLQFGGAAREEALQPYEVALGRGVGEIAEDISLEAVE